MHFLRSLTLVACVALAGCASGRTGAGRGAPPINAVLSGDALLIVEADADNSRDTSRAEFEAALVAGFAQADSDANTTLSPIEWQAWSRAVMGADLVGPFRLEIDRNVDNQITQQEFTDELTARFDRYDVDQSGTLSRAELVRSFEPRSATERPRPAPPRPSPGGN
ncbi:MAG: EF-hand domain-containing protein [Caulobacterales bacterium]